MVKTENFGKFLNGKQRDWEEPGVENAIMFVRVCMKMGKITCSYADENYLKRTLKLVP